MSTEQKPLPCPFCNSIVLVVGGFHVHCVRCGAEGPDSDTPDEASIIAAWNRRDVSKTAPNLDTLAERVHEARISALEEAAQAVIDARDNFGWSSDVDDKIEELRRALSLAGDQQQGGAT